MKRIALLFALFSLSALADTPMWQRNNGVWEAVVRVSKDEPYWEFGDFHGVTNGYIYIAGYTNYYTETRIEVVWTYWTRNAGTSSNYRPDTSGPYATIHSYNFSEATLPAYTNDLAQKAQFRSIDSIIRHEVPCSQYVPPKVLCGELPCRFGVPETITVDLPYADHFELLPLSWPDTVVRIRCGFDGYLLVRFEESDMQISIKRLLPEKLPYERTPQNIRVSVDDLLHGV